LAADRQALAMTQAAVAGQVHQALDVDGGFPAQVALDGEVAVDGLADLQHLGVAQLVDAASVLDADLLHDIARLRGADAMDVLQRDHHALVGGNIDACDTGHVLISPGHARKARTAPRPLAPKVKPVRPSRSFAEALRYRDRCASVNNGNSHL